MIFYFRFIFPEKTNLIAGKPSFYKECRTNLVCGAYLLEIGAREISLEFNPQEKTLTWIIHKSICRSGILPLLPEMRQDAASTLFMNN